MLSRLCWFTARQPPRSRYAGVRFRCLATTMAGDCAPLVPGGLVSGKCLAYLQETGNKID